MSPEDVNIFEAYRAAYAFPKGSLETRLRRVWRAKCVAENHRRLLPYEGPDFHTPHTPSDEMERRIEAAKELRAKGLIWDDVAKELGLTHGQKCAVITGIRRRRKAAERQA